MTTPIKDAEPMANGVAFPNLEHYIPYIYPQPVSLLDYAPPDALIVVEDWAELRDTIAGVEQFKPTRRRLLDKAVALRATQHRSEQFGVVVAAGLRDTFLG